MSKLIGKKIISILCYKNSFILTLLISGGYYIYYETTGGNTGDIAQLQSPRFTVGSRTYCLSFWYYMYGQTVDTLNVYLKSGNRLGSPIWTRSHTQGQQWKQATVNLRSKRNVQVWPKQKQMSNSKKPYQPSLFEGGYSIFSGAGASEIFFFFDFQGFPIEKNIIFYQPTHKNIVMFSKARLFCLYTLSFIMTRLRLHC